MDPTSPHWAIRKAPRCLTCGSETRHRRTSRNNPNGNAGRPLYECTNSKCLKFSCFGDMRGVLMDNPACDCSSLLHSRLQIAGRDRQYPRALHYTCAVGRCSYFSYLTNERDEKIIYTGPILAPAEMARCGL
ncbi:hypothetical protein BDV41DRAFT_538684 [Aspergillus transmontanensis]|uniref:GRF-like zinc ribbon domain-containing protein n=1 Tax=Aspergillus transmontanensis TaxID=1034304 RepID=A0A5N6VWM2_9EURO|nr:hypothetical protein BDV41DRAFT_538684 [Aspergillus transmontanensis]